ncbi:hypothetical protein [Novosphingobium sp.]|uniref:hypothetical protein n=1 Tax=Novosphingobium sp. TaxID=1874826 RepID=UPI0025D935A7|nr:hypothetical protein [Novosphingobium sp.]MCC6926793.1 hypothetical protein [Novosphingobium sp.]
MTRRMISAWLALAAGLLAAAPVAATSVVAARPHDPQSACPAVLQLVADINAGKPRGDHAARFHFFYTDALGEVDLAEEPVLAKALREANGKPDRLPAALGGIWPLAQGAGHRKDQALYVIVLRRETWQLVRYETDAMLMPTEIPDPHWDSDNSTWLVAFDENRIRAVREARELSLLTDPKKALKCPPV